MDLQRWKGSSQVLAGWGKASLRPSEGPYPGFPGTDGVRWILVYRTQIRWGMHEAGPVPEGRAGSKTERSIRLRAVVLSGSRTSSREASKKDECRLSDATRPTWGRVKGTAVISVFTGLSGNSDASQVLEPLHQRQTTPITDPHGSCQSFRSQARGRGQPSGGESSLPGLRCTCLPSPSPFRPPPSGALVASWIHFTSRAVKEPGRP